MRIINLVVSAFISALTLAAPLALAQDGNVKQQISALSDEMIQANLKGDASFYQKYYADDATIIHGNGKLFTKDQDIADLKSGALKYESIDVREKTIRVYGDTAVVHLLLTFKGSLSGQAFDPINLRRTVVWVKQQGNWKVVAWQVTRAENK
ncbi:nuclear transport factor 2 family protein [Cupriavidus sp. BIC8F]|uniref:nuclear transport factor 2 family protein n=1 Tax=Cupriavidus sp. BIC8F TaxID=3079014 RepID=UPI0029161D4F|nr:nuclear transport factor 2 family protein [Cupriavidus sp. BIC8F]